MTVGELQFAEHGRHVAFDGLDGEVEPRAHLSIRVAAGDQTQHLLFPLGELVELGVGGHREVTGEGVEYETGEAW